jgi:hypothetical protein
MGWGLLCVLAIGLDNGDNSRPVIFWVQLPILHLNLINFIRVCTIYIYQPEWIVGHWLLETWHRQYQSHDAVTSWKSWTKIAVLSTSEPTHWNISFVNIWYGCFFVPICLWLFHVVFSLIPCLLPIYDFFCFYFFIIRNHFSSLFTLYILCSGFSLLYSFYLMFCAKLVMMNLAHSEVHTEY